MPASDPPDQRVKDASVLQDLFTAYLVGKQGMALGDAQRIASGEALKHMSVVSVASKFMAAIIDLIAPFAAGVLEAFAGAKQETKSAMNDVIGGALEEFLGVKVDVSNAASGEGVEAGRERAHTIGDAVHKLLLDEFGGLREISPQDGADNARTFTGFAVNFGVTNAFMGLLGELLSLGQIDQFRELGVEVAQNMGLGRLQRLAMQPLIRNMVQQPYDLYLKSQLRPDRLNEAQVINALRAGDLTDEQARQQLAEKGYRDQDIDILVDQLALKVQPAEIERLVRHSVITDQQGIDKLKTQGMTEEDARNYLKSLDAARADTQVSAMLTNLETARLGGFIDQNQLVGLVNDLPLGPLETEMFLRRVGRQAEIARREITFAQLKTGVLESVVDFSFVDQWLRNKGYSEEENTILTYEIISALATAEAKAAAKAAKCKQLQAAGKPCPP